MLLWQTGAKRKRYSGTVAGGIASALNINVLPLLLDPSLLKDRAGEVVQMQPTTNGII